VDWCDKCVWQQRETRAGGTDRGVKKVFHFICLHAKRYIVPSFGLVGSPFCFFLLKMVLYTRIGCVCSGSAMG
jgi:hypothetical protein